MISPGLIHHYNTLWASLDIAPGERQARQIVAGRAEYQAVERRTGVPWFLVGIIHSLESNFDFRTHLHNGDPLTDRAGRPAPTVRVPSGRGPFASWRESAADALLLKAWQYSSFGWRWIHEYLAALEVYNGLGYLYFHPECNSPYLWGLSELHSYGKYVSDGRWDADATTRQAGGAVILRCLMQGWGELLPRIGVQAVASWQNPLAAGAGRWEVSRLQHYLNQQPGERLKIDGYCGPLTRARFEAVLGKAA